MRANTSTWSVIAILALATLAARPARAQQSMSLVAASTVATPALDAAGGAAKTLSQVPAYNWYHGCGPTAAASIIGYYDMHGFNNLFTASGWDNVKITSNVQDQISSPAHNAKYDPDPDNGSLPDPPYTSVADWFRTSVNQGYGWSYLNDAIWAFMGYANYRGYTCSATNQSYGQFSWSTLTSEIDAGRPVMFLVDSDGNGGTDHFVPVFGYEDRGVSGQFYACYTTWHEDETVDWFQFRPMSGSYTWGVGYATLVTVTPEPASLSLLAVGALAIFRRRR